MIQRRYINTPQGEVHVRTAGRPDRPAILLLHQTASSSVMFEALMRELGDAFWLVAPDTPGFGESFRPAEKATMALYREAMLAVVDALGIGRCALFGHHTGASIAVDMAAHRPRLASRLVLGGPCLFSEAEARERAAQTRVSPESESGEHLLATWRRIAQKDPAAPLWLRQRETLLTELAGPRWVEGYHAVFDHAAEFERSLRALTLPTLVFAGEQDTVFHRLDAAHGALRDGHKAVLANQSTYVCDLAPRQVAALLRDFCVS